MKRDHSLDLLLDLDGQVLVVDPEGNHWVRFMVRRVPVTEGRPHGLAYSLSLHGPDGERLVASTTPIRCARERGRADENAARRIIGTG